MGSWARWGSMSADPMAHKPATGPCPSWELTAHVWVDKTSGHHPGKRVMLLRQFRYQMGKPVMVIFLNHQVTWLLSFVLQENGPESLLFFVRRRVQLGHFHPWGSSCVPSTMPGTMEPSKTVCVNVSASVKQSGKESMKY